MDSIFGKKQTPRQIARGMGREIDREKRHINRDVKDFERQEKQLMFEIKKEVEKGNTDRAKVLARQLVRVRKSKGVIENSTAQLDNVKMQAKTMASNAAVADSLGKATKVMTKINKIANPEDIVKKAAKFEQEMEKAKLKEEVIDETLSAAFDGDGVEEATDEMVNQVLDEVGLKKLEDLESAPMGDVTIGNKSKEKRASDAKEKENELFDGI